jgi:hypothetical protein
LRGYETHGEQRSYQERTAANSRCEIGRFAPTLHPQNCTRSAAALSRHPHRGSEPWTSRASAANNQWSSVTSGGPTGQELFVAVAGGHSGTGNRVTTSATGTRLPARCQPQPVSRNAGSGSHTSLTLFVATPTRDPAKPHTAGWDYRVRCLGRSVARRGGWRPGYCAHDMCGSFHQRRSRAISRWPSLTRRTT